MVSEKIIIKNKSGIHARPAGELARVTKNCKSETFLIHGDKIVNLKSVLNVMAAAIHVGTEVIIQCDGENEAEDLNKILDAINSGLGEA